MTRAFALLAGIVFLVVGILGFVPGLAFHHVLWSTSGTTGGHEYLLGIFAVDRLHDLINIIIGALGVAAFLWDRATSYCLGLGIVCSLVGILGFIPVPVYASGIWLGLFHVNLADSLLYLIVGVIAACSVSPVGSAVDVFPPRLDRPYLSG